MRVTSISLTLAAVLALSGPLRAATVNALQGQVLVNAGQGYRLVNGVMQLEAGGTVVANPGAIAQVVYSGGCTVTVHPGSVYLIASRPPCRSDETETKQADNPTEPPGSSGSTTTWIVGGALLAGGGGAAAYLLSAGNGSDDDKPLSP